MVVLIWRNIPVWVYSAKFKHPRGLNRVKPCHPTGNRPQTHSCSCCGGKRPWFNKMSAYLRFTLGWVRFVMFKDPLARRRMNAEQVELRIMEDKQRHLAGDDSNAMTFPSAYCPRRPPRLGSAVASRRFCKSRGEWEHQAVAQSCCPQAGRGHAAGFRRSKITVILITIFFTTIIKSRQKFWNILKCWRQNIRFGCWVMVDGQGYAGCGVWPHKDHQLKLRVCVCVLVCLCGQ